MKIIHTSDWHLGQNFYHYDRDDEHQYFFAQLAAILGRERPDALVVSGDVFHTAAPSASAQRLFVEGVMWLHDASPETRIIITAGNHDSGSRLDAERELWHRLGVHVIGTCRRNADGTFDPTQFVVEIPGRGYVVAVPYFHPSNYPLAATDTGREERQRAFFEAVLRQPTESGLPVVMMAHLAVDGCDTSSHDDIAVGGMLKESIADLGTGYDYLALGHIHMPQPIGKRARYCGSPVPVSFSEEYDHFVDLVEIDQHGQLPKVSHLLLDLKRPVRTIPKDGAPLEQALQELSKLDPKDECYVRVLVDQDEVLAPDAEDRARKLVDGYACRLCEVHRKPRVYTPTAKTDSLQVADMSDFEVLKPIDIAIHSYERKHGKPMSDTLRQLMEQVIDKAQQELGAANSKN